LIDIESLVKFCFRIVALITHIFIQGFTNSWHVHVVTSSLWLEYDCSEAKLVLNFQHLFSYLGSSYVFKPELTPYGAISPSKGCTTSLI